MPINAERALTATFAPVPFRWTADDVIRYHLALGAGSPVSAGAELRYIYEDVLQVLGTFAVVPASAAAATAAAAPGLDYDRNRILHGEHAIELLAPLPAAAEVVNTAKVAAIYDKGRSAHLVIEVDTAHLDGRPLARNTFRLILPGEGGFTGGTNPPTAPTPSVPTGEPDAVYRVPTLPQQAALYRMSGDRNPLHIDPQVARDAGFAGPTLPGLCTLGMVAKALIDAEADGDVNAMRAFSARFAGPVYPGETLAVSVWRDESQPGGGQSGEHHVQVDVIERSAPALSSGRFTASR